MEVASGNGKLLRYKVILGNCPILAGAVKGKGDLGNAKGLSPLQQEPLDPDLPVRYGVVVQDYEASMIDFSDRSQPAPSEVTESFREFIAKRKSGDNPAGDFVKDVRRDKCFPAAAQTWKEVEHHMCARPHWACDEAVAVGKRLWNKYARENALNPAGWPPLPKKTCVSSRQHWLSRTPSLREMDLC